MGARGAVLGGGFINRRVWELNGRWEAFFIGDLGWAFCFFFFSFTVCVCECVLLGFYWEGVNMCGDDPILHLILESFIRYG